MAHCSPLAAHRLKLLHAHPGHASVVVLGTWTGDLDVLDVPPRRASRMPAARINPRDLVRWQLRWALTCAMSDMACVANPMPDLSNEPRHLDRYAGSGLD